MEEDLSIGEGESQVVGIKIPQCCREGWEDCKHVPKKREKKRVNIGL